MQRSRLMLGLMTVLIIFAGSQMWSSFAQNGDDRQPRTYYDSLDLTTPESAAMTFVDAFHRQDFPTNFLIFSPHAQSAIQEHYNLLEYDKLINHEGLFDPLNEMLRQSLTEIEQFSMSGYFDLFMLFAADHDAFIIDLRGEVAILETRASDAVIENVDRVMDVVTSVEGIEGEVVFRMVTAPSGKWRVYQVITAGGDESQLPWAIPAPTVNAYSVEWDTPCDDELPVLPEPDTETAYIIVEPGCGNIDSDRPPFRDEEATSVTIEGFNFAPDVDVNLWMETAENNAISLAAVVPNEDGEFSVTLVIPDISMRISSTQSATIEIRAEQIVTHYP